MGYGTYSNLSHQTVPQIVQTVQETEEEDRAAYTEIRKHLHRYQEDPLGVLQDKATHIPLDRYDNHYDDAH
jgi:hypothetical protein